MAIVGGFDVHRAQITFDYLGTDTSMVSTGQIRPATRAALRGRLAECFAARDDVAFAVEGCTGWQFVAEEMQRAALRPNMWPSLPTPPPNGVARSEPRPTAPTPRLQRELLAQGRLPESWIPPAHVPEVGTLARVYVALMNDRRAWQQRIHAQAFHQVALPVSGVLSDKGRTELAKLELSPAGHQVVGAALSTVDEINALIVPLRAQLSSVGRRQQEPER